MLKRYRIHQPESVMHGWIVNGTLTSDRLAGYDFDYIAFRYEGIDYGVPLDWCVETNRTIRPADEDTQPEMAL